MAQHDEMLEEHRQTWSAFVKLTTATIIGVIVLLGGMALTLL